MARKLLHVRGLEAPFPEPVGSAGGEHDQAVQAEPARLGLEVFQQLVAAPPVAVVGVDSEAGELGRPLVREGIESGAADDGTVAFDDGEVIDLRLNALAGTAYQHAFLFQGRDQLENACHVVDAGLADGFPALGRDQGAGAVTGEEFTQQHAILPARQDVGAGNPVAAGVDGVAQHPLELFSQFPAAREELLGLRGHEAADEPAATVRELLVGEEDELVRLQGHRRFGGHVGGIQVEHLAGG